MRILFTVLLLIPVFVRSQGDSIKYTKDYNFKGGIYLSFEQFRDQRPLSPERIVSNYDHADPNFISQVLSKHSFTYKNDKDSLISVKTSGVWGYSKGGIVFINHGKEFNRLVVIGSLCHFTAFVTTASYQSDPFNLGTSTQPGYAQEQFMLDMLMGKVMPFSSIAMEFILQRDEGLLKEWQGLSKSKRKKSAFLFLRKYNEKYPLYFPS